MPDQTKLKGTPSEVEDVDRQRAISLSSYLQRWIPYWGHPGWLNAERWRAFVRNQSVAIITRDTLITNMLSMNWQITAKDSADGDKREIRKAIDYYTDLFTYLEGDFDTYCELMAQDLLDLPFGAMAEVVREDDKPDGPVLGMFHVDAATLFPTGVDEFPVQQRVPELPGSVVNFPKHSVARIMMTARPEIRRKGWGMAPPEKAYLAIEMLFRGDRYYANLLLDTPEAGILDLIDMDAETADQWIEGMREMFHGIDGFKVPVLHSHSTPAQWIPLNRPPTDMLYNEVTMKYAAILTAAYGMRTSDIGMTELSGEKTLAGVIRGERQTRKSGFALVRTKFENHFNNVLPAEIKFSWIDDDEETKLSESKTLVSFGQGLQQLASAGLLSKEEARQEIVSRGLLSIEIDPEELPEDPQEAASRRQQEFQMGQQVQGQRFQRGEREAGENFQSGQFDKQNKPPFPFGRPSAGAEDDKKPPSQGGRGQGGFSLRSLFKRVPDDDLGNSLPPDGNWTKTDLLAMMNQIIEPAQQHIVRMAYEEPSRIRRLIRAATKTLFPIVSRTFNVLTDEQIVDYWLPESMAFDMGEPSELDSVVMRQNQEDVFNELDKHLEDDPWWHTASEIEKAQVLRIYAQAASVGLGEMALKIVQDLYEEGLRETPTLIGLNFELTNPRTMLQLEERAAEFVTQVNDGTKFFIKRIISAGVRQGLSSPVIAQAIREGEAAEEILRRDDFMGDIEKFVREALVEMSRNRSESIVNTEVNRAENLGVWLQMKNSGLTVKRWVHLGERGVTKKGNPHPCPVCEGNENMGYVDMDFMFPTVFKSGGDDGEGGQLGPPAHPQVCHCTLSYERDEMIDKLSVNYKPYLGE